MVKKVKTNLDSSNAYGLDYTPLVVLKNWAWTVYLLAELFKMSQGGLFSRLLECLINGPCI